MAKIVRMHGLGAADVLRLEEVEVPAPGAGEVLIRVAAIGLNRVEAMFRSGGYWTPELPSKLGYEAAGTIEAVGPDVTEWAVGDRVACIPGLSMEQYGTYGEQILYRADMLVATPDGQSDVEAAATWMQYLTAFAILWEGKLTAGDPVVITAASSSVGLAAIQLANLVGAVPIAVTRGRGKADALSAAGAAHVIVSDEQDVAEAIRAATGGAGAAMLFDAIGGPGFAGLVGALRPHAQAIIYGQLGGPIADLPSGLMTYLDVTVRGYAANHLIAIPAQRERALATIQAGLADGTLKPVIDRTFPLDEIADAHRYLEGNTQFGKIVVTV